MKDRSDLVAEVVARAIEAAGDGEFDKADDILRRAVHFGMRPIDIVLNALAARATTVTPPADTGEPMMWVVYDGPEDGVQLAASLGDIYCQRGTPLELPADVARSLLHQPHFRRPRKGEIPETPDRTETPESFDPSIETR